MLLLCCSGQECLRCCCWLSVNTSTRSSHARFYYFRCTAQIKTVFVGLFYSAIVPTGLIVTAVAMSTLYWVDKYSLLRLWKRPPVRKRGRSVDMVPLIYDSTVTSHLYKLLLHVTVSSYRYRLPLQVTASRRRYILPFQVTVTGCRHVIPLHDTVTNYRYRVQRSRTRRRADMQSQTRAFLLMFDSAAFSCGNTPFWARFVLCFMRVTICFCVFLSSLGRRTMRTCQSTHGSTSSSASGCTSSWREFSLPSESPRSTVVVSIVHTVLLYEVW